MRGLFERFGVTWPTYGDWIAAPGLLSEVAWASAVEASRAALELAARPSLRRVA